ncbi:hypothetical protein [Chondromyces apiculatus]|uniref:Cell surface protein n=1 Tax=Chondromyces apiculatus DSM 436 TaxID=1192034 RepID=A0A017T699_9BACT|nr:hypothetical protein [Chondromyces apiculatus]EYF04754.1 Hypothetical protein CAP_4230 [Chondromyces apiculatus DSM 436]
MNRPAPLRTVARLALAGLFLVPAAFPAASCAPVERDFGVASTGSASGPCETAASCYTGPAGTEGVGACRAGSQVCDGEGYGACEGEVLPAVDDCTTPEDEDCDGVAAPCSLSTVWARGFLGVSPQDTPRLAMDGEGNIIVVGSFVEMIDFGDGDPLTTSAERQPFIAKFDPYGTVLWSRKISGTGQSAIKGLAVDALGRILIAGDLSGEAIFDDTVLTNSQGFDDIFLARLASATGNVDWAYGFGSTDYDRVNDLAVDENGNPVLIGEFSGTLAFGSVSMTAQSGSESFLVKMSPDGVFGIYARNFGSSNGILDFEALAPDRAGGVLLSGRFSTTAPFDNVPLTSLGSNDGFLAHFSSTGSAVSAKNLGGVEWDRTYDVTSTPDDGSAVSGTFSGSVDFGGGPLEALDGSSFFVAAYDAEGSHRFSVAFGTGEDTGHSAVLRVDAEGNTVVTGYFNNEVTFGEETYPLTGTQDQDLDGFVVKLDGTGEVLASRAIGTTLPEGIFDVVIDPSGTPVIVGMTVGGTLDLGTGPLPSDGMTPTLFIAKLAP